MSNGVIITRIIATQNLSWEGEACASHWNRHIKSSLFQAVVEFRQEMQVLYASNQAKFRVFQRCHASNCIHKAFLRFFLAQFAR